MVNANDNDLVEVKSIEDPGLDLFDVGEPAPPADATSPAPVQPGAESQPPQAEAPPAPPPAPQLPAWLADLTPEERGAVIASGLQALTPEQLVQMEPVRELLGQAQNYAASQASEYQRQQAEQNQRNQFALQRANAFESELAQFAPADYDLRPSLDNYTLAVQQDYHGYLAGQVQKGILDGFARLGISPQNLPPQLVARVGQARDYNGVVQAYVDAAADRAFELGRIKERNDSGTRSQADETALRARIRNEVLGQLSKDGKLAIGKDDDSGYFAQLQTESTPPSLSGSPVPVSSELDDAEVLAALADPDAYDRLMSDPAKAKAFNKAMAGELARGAN